MNTPQEWKDNDRDPLGLRELPMLSPDEDGWPAIEQALLNRQRARKRMRVAGGWLAAAASVVLVVGLVVRQPGPVNIAEPGTESVATQTPSAASVADENTVESLIAMSQMLERQLRGLRGETGPMPADSAVYVAELEDLVAQVDNELSFAPDSINLWGQRVNLLLDLAQLYQHQWERQYGRMASL